MTKKELQKIADRFNALETDLERYRFVLENKPTLGLLLDNDDTQAIFTGEAVGDLSYEDLPDLNGFDNYIGNSDGVYKICEALGIHAEGV